MSKGKKQKRTKPSKQQLKFDRKTRKVLNAVNELDRWLCLGADEKREIVSSLGSNVTHLQDLASHLKVIAGSIMDDYPLDPDDDGEDRHEDGSPVSAVNGDCLNPAERAYIG